MTSEHEETSYTVKELRQALTETGNSGLATSFLDEVAAQAEKNRKLANPGEFTEAQVRRALDAHLKPDTGNHVESRNVHCTVKSLSDAIVATLRSPEKPQEFTEGGVYRYPPKNTLYRRQQGRWQAFGMSGSWDDMHLPVPLTDLERVL